MIRCIKLHQILHALGHQIFGGNLDYKAHSDSDHVAKFHGDRLSELGDLVAKGVNNICGKT